MRARPPQTGNPLQACSIAPRPPVGSWTAPRRKERVQHGLRGVMGILDRSVSSFGYAGEHAERVYLVAEGAPSPPEIEEVSSSWRRSAKKHGVDPVDSSAPRILTQNELKDFREPLDKLIFSAQEEIDQLYTVVREAGYVALFCDSAGVAVEHRGENARASQFAYWGAWLGGVWSEVAEGTNGIGTCIVEERPVTIHKSQHFRSRHINLSCSGAPVFGVDGRLVAVLDVSAIDPELSGRAHALTGALTTKSARAIEERFFREQFRREWIVAVVPPEGQSTGILLAVDGDQRIVGVNRAARRILLLDDRGLHAGVSLWKFFERNLDLFRRKNGTDICTMLLIAGSADSCPALVTPPDQTIVSSNAANNHVHTRPRLDSIGTLMKLAPAPLAHGGGLSPSAMRRVRDYVERHLSETIDLSTLAAAAGLSMHHFARQFKQSAGVTPHHYVTQKRLELAQGLLTKTELPVAEIAYAAGFSDQSHLARHFRHVLRTTPRAFRDSRS
jgi:transcriptional regulator of acetoin/glycerol metabolism